MGVFYHEEEPPPDLTKRCRCLTKALKVKDAFSHCHNLSRQVSCRTHEDDDEEEDNPLDDPNEEQEAIVSEIRSRAIAKLRQKPNLSADGFSCVFSSPGIGELHFFTIDGLRKKEAKDDDQGVENEEFESMRSYFTGCSGVVASREAFFSAKSNLSHSTSLNDLDIRDLKRRLIFRELCHCEGWPFGLCRKLLFLPPLPKSPTESWSFPHSDPKHPNLIFKWIILVPSSTATFFLATHSNTVIKFHFQRSQYTSKFLHCFCCAKNIGQSLLSRGIIGTLRQC